MTKNPPQPSQSKKSSPSQPKTTRAKATNAKPTPPRRPRKETARHFGVLLVMALATIVLTTVCLMLILGYQLNPAQQTITQGGLVKYGSFPRGATITLDGYKLSPKTPHQQTETAIAHRVSFALDGYRPWGTNFTVEPGKLAWIDYARLVPTTITTDDLRSFTTLAGNLSAPNPRYMALLPASDQPLIAILDLNDAKNITSTDITIPTELLTPAPDKPQRFSIHQWSHNSDYLTLRRDFGDAQTEFFRLQRSNPRAIVNVTNELGSQFSELRFAHTSNDEFYGLSDGILRRVNLDGEGSLSAPIASRVSQFKPYKTEGVVYVTESDNEKRVEAVVKNTTFKLATFAKTTPVFVDIGEYYEEFYVAVASEQTLRIHSLDISSKKSAFYATIPLQTPVSWVDFASTYRHVIAGHDTAYATYDIDTKHAYHKPAEGTRGAFAGQAPKWLDESYVTIDADNKLLIRDYNGANDELIASGLTGYDSALSRNEESFYFIAAGEGESKILRRANMVVE